MYEWNIWIVLLGLPVWASYMSGTPQVSDTRWALRMLSIHDSALRAKLLTEYIFYHVRYSTVLFSMTDDKQIQHNLFVLYASFRAAQKFN